MEYFKKSLLNSIDCEVTVLQDMILVKSWDDGQLPTNLRQFLETTLVVRQSVKTGGEIQTGSILNALDRNIFKGKLRELLEKYKLVGIWREALRRAVLVADRQVTHYIQVSGFPLTSGKSTLAWTVTGLKKEIFRECMTEKLSRLYDQKHVIIDRKRMPPGDASDKLDAYRDCLRGQDPGILGETFERWIKVSGPEKVTEVFSSILLNGHPVRRTLDNFLRREQGANLLETFSSDCSVETSRGRVADQSASLLDRCVPRNLIFESSRKRLGKFVKEYMLTRIDHGSVELLEKSLRDPRRTPKWMKRFDLGNNKLFLQCLCVLLVRLVVLNIHAVFEVSSRGSSPKIPEYAPKRDIALRRRECLAHLVKNNLEPTDIAAQGKMLALPKAAPFEYRPVFKYTQSKPCLSVPLRSYLQCLKSDSQARLRAPICAMNSALALQRVATLRQKGKLYFVKGDVRDCYGSVDLVTLKQSLSQNWPTPNRAWEFIELDFPLRPGSRKKKRFYLFEDRIFRRPLCDGRLSVLVPTGKLSIWEPQKELRAVVEWMGNIVVEIGDSKYRFRKGVPQGALLSAFLADLYLALHVDQLFERFQDDLAVFRTMDDYLAVSTSPQTAQRCLHILKNESLHEGLVFSESKFLINWPLRAEEDESFIPQPFSYCGEELDPVSGHFRFSADYKAFLGNARCYRKDLHGRPIERAFKYLLASSYWGYSMGLFSYEDGDLPRLLRNIFEAAADSALRFRSYVDDSNVGTSSLLRFFRVHRLVFTRYVRTAVFKHSLGSLIISRRGLLYLHRRAFERVLGWRKSRYLNLLKEIEELFSDSSDIEDLRHKKLLLMASRVL